MTPSPPEEPATSKPPAPEGESTEGEATEVAALLGDGVRSPVGIPRQYRPSETSAHTLLRVELEDFAGPLDLLLYLIRQHDLDIFNIPIAFITEKYLAVLDTLSELPLEVAAEFLVMAAELAHIKSKMLLPPKEGVPVEAEDEGPEDPRGDLVRRLLEYQKYRDAAVELGDREQLGRDVFARAATSESAVLDFDPGLRDLSIFRLVEAMADVLSRLQPETQHEVIADTVSINERMRYILAYGEQHGPRIRFLSLFEGVESRRVVVVTFLAILELARTRAARIEQEPAPEDACLVEQEVPAAGTNEPAVAGPWVEAPPAAEDLEGLPEGDLEEADLPPVGAAQRPRLQDLPPLLPPEPGDIVLVLTGIDPEVVTHQRDDYRG